MSAVPNSDAPTPTKKRLTLKEAATKVGVSTATIRRRIKDGSLRAYQTLGKFGHQWVVTPDDLDTLSFMPGESVLDDDDGCEPGGGEEAETPPGPSAHDQPPPSPETEGFEGPPPTTESQPGIACPSLEQQALHQAGYWKGRWDEARDRVLELEHQLQSIPIAQLSEQAEASRLAEENALRELQSFKTQLEQAQRELEASRQEVVLLKRPWWRRLLEGHPPQKTID